MNTIMLPIVTFEEVPTFRVVTNKRTLFVRANSKSVIFNREYEFMGAGESITSIWENVSVIDLGE